MNPKTVNLTYRSSSGASVGPALVVPNHSGLWWRAKPTPTWLLDVVCVDGGAVLSIAPQDIVGWEPAGTESPVPPEDARQLALPGVPEC